MPHRIRCEKRKKNMENLTEAIIDKLEQPGIPKEELKTNIDKMPRTNTQPVIVRFKTHSFKEKNYSK